MGYSRKKKKKGEGERGGVVSHLSIYFSEKEPGNLTSATLGTFMKFQRKQALWKFYKIVWRHCFMWKSQSQKPELMEIPYESFWNTPENSTSFIIDLWHLQFLLCMLYVFKNKGEVLIKWMEVEVSEP